MTEYALSVNQALALTADEPSQTAISGYTNGLCWSQAVARKSASSPASLAYFDAMTQELSRVAWLVNEATAFDLKQSGSKLAAAAVITSALSAYVSEDFANGIDALFQAAGQDTVESNPADNFLSTWWKQSSSALSDTAMLIGELKGGSTTTVRLLWFTFASRLDAWQSLFVSGSSASLSASALTLEMTFVPDLWTPIEQQVIDKLGDNARAAIHALKL